ncbi:PH domain-containing protein [Haloterrigena sp. SYSU A558-1]|uniref:PH domain-containing protein n=1 Tax=Haloterrigena gelatinilytica TaxID=2741724 RepID=A0ABX2LIC7_9EURY|nr:PH domain-containing protein [Haloterrigena gelatinilytica]NUC74133.1 PH domain-containing protein [Haloterrigena gelatinilytica]
MDEPSSRSPAESATNRIHPRIRIVWAITWLLVGVVAAIVATVVLSDSSLERPLLTVAAASPVAGIPLAVVRYRRFRYAITDDGVYVRRGLVTVNETVVPAASIQQVDVDEPLLARPFGLVSVRLYTAGTFGGRVAIPGLDSDTAADLADRLDRLARGESGV